MKALSKLLILLGAILCTRANNITPPSPIIRYNICYENSKYCLYCNQEVGVIRFTKRDSDEYRIPIMDKLNRARSQYALANGISNMKFTSWANEFEAMTGELVGYSKPVIECNDKNGTNETKKKYKVLEYKSEISVIPKNLEKELRDLLDNLTDQVIVDPDMMIYNLYQFGCSYSYDRERSKLTAIMRCMGYIENRNNIDLQLGKYCEGCDNWNDRCIELDWYKGLCVNNHFNETRLRLMIEPEVKLTWVMPYQLMFRVSIYVLNVIVLFVIVYVVYAACVICRHNHIFGIRRLSNERTIEIAMPMVENIYNHV